MGRRILFFPFNLLSHNLRCLEMASAINDSFEVWLPDRDCTRNLRNIKSFDYQGINPEPVLEAAKKFDFSWINRATLEDTFHEQVAILLKLKPDAVVGDASFTLRMAASVTGTPYIALVNAYMTRFYKNTRRLPPSHPAAKHTRHLHPWLFNHIIRLAEQNALRKVHRPFREMAMQHNIISRDNLMHEIEGDLTLITDDPHLFPLLPLPANTRVIGPACYSSPTQEPAILNFISNGKPNILLCTGSHTDPAPYLHLIDPRFRDFNIITTLPLPKAVNIYHQTFISLPAIMRYMDFVICHGGNGTIYHALAAGKPLLCAPAHFEQEWNLQALEARQYGLRLAEKPEFILAQLDPSKFRKPELVHSPSLTPQLFRKELIHFLLSRSKHTGTATVQ